MAGSRRKFSMPVGTHNRSVILNEIDSINVERLFYPSGEISDYSKTLLRAYIFFNPPFGKMHFDDLLTATYELLDQMEQGCKTLHREEPVTGDDHLLYREVYGMVSCWWIRIEGLVNKDPIITRNNHIIAAHLYNAGFCTTSGDLERMIEYIQEGDHSDEEGVDEMLDRFRDLDKASGDIMRDFDKDMKEYVQRISNEGLRPQFDTPNSHAELLYDIVSSFPTDCLSNAWPMNEKEQEYSLEAGRADESLCFHCYTDEALEWIDNFTSGEYAPVYFREAKLYNFEISQDNLPYLKLFEFCGRFDFVTQKFFIHAEEDIRSIAPELSFISLRLQRSIRVVRRSKYGQNEWTFGPEVARGQEVVIEFDRKVQNGAGKH